MKRIALALALLAFAAACSKKPAPAPAPPPPPVPQPKQNVVVLFAEGARVGRVVVSNAGGSVELSEANAAARIENNATAPQMFTMDKAESDRIFGPALKLLPPPEVHFTLPFDPSSDRLSPEARNVIASILAAIRERRSTDVTVTGHTDTTGSAETNYALALRRAESVAAELRSAGVDRAILFVTSHGEGDLLIKTADNVAEPRNRRVEVVVR